MQARGAVLGAITMTDTTFQVPLELREALALSHDTPVTAYDRRNWDLIQYSKGLQSIPVPSQLKLNEAASLYQVWGEDRALNDGESYQGLSFITDTDLWSPTSSH